MAKTDMDNKTPFDPAATPRGRQEPQSGTLKDVPDKLALHEKLDGVVDRWFDDCIKGGPIGRHTPSYNHLHGALDQLKQRLTQHLTRED